MNSDDKFWLSIWVTIALAVGVIAGAFLLGSMSVNQHYYNAVNECTHQGGMWIPLGQSGTCVRR